MECQQGFERCSNGMCISFWNVGESKGPTDSNNWPTPIFLHGEWDSDVVYPQKICVGVIMIGRLQKNIY